MGKETGIAWTRSTRNFWSGCTKVGPGCDGCYAEASSRRMRGVNAETGQAMNWGPGAARVPHLAGADKDLRKWDQICAIERGGGKPGRYVSQGKAEPKKWVEPIKCFTDGWSRPGFWPVFINSYSDVLDNDVPEIWRSLLCTTTEECTYLNPQLVTKRIGNALKLFPAHWLREWPAHIWMLITVVNQEELDRDGTKLMELADMAGIKVIGLSVEPQIGEIDARPFLELAAKREQTVWGIGGGESAQPGHPARAFYLEWGIHMAQHFAEAGQPFFFKQAGTNPWHNGAPYHLGKGKGDDPAEWPEVLRVREFPV